VRVVVFDEVDELLARGPDEVTPNPGEATSPDV
jgi:hypothetical protein